MNYMGPTGEPVQVSGMCSSHQHRQREDLSDHLDLVYPHDHYLRHLSPPSAHTSTSSLPASVDSSEKFQEHSIKPDQKTNQTLHLRRLHPSTDSGPKFRLHPVQRPHLPPL